MTTYQQPTSRRPDSKQPAFLHPAGRTAPIGATLMPGGANFSIFSRSATSMELLFFDRVDDARPSRVIPIDAVNNRTYHYWHVFVPGVRAGQIYGFRANGPFEPDSAVVLIATGARCS